MTERAALLNQLKIDRGADRAPPASRRRWWVGGAAAALAAAGLIGLPALSGARTVPVKVAAARAASAARPAAGASLLDASGYVVAQRQATVSGKITGRVVQVLIEEGQQVEGDQVIARLDDTNTQAALEQAAASVALAEATLAGTKTAFANQKAIYVRDQQLQEAGWLSAAALDTSRIAFQQRQLDQAVAERNLDLARKTLGIAQRNQDDTVIRAPFTGVITAKAAQAGEIISPLSTGGFTRTGIGTIVDMASLEVEVDVNENFISRIHAGQPAAVKLNAYPDWEIAGFVIAVVPTADRSKATVKVRIGLKDKDSRIVPEMGARVSFLASDAPAAETAAVPVASVLVPVDAVQANGDTGVVFIVEDGVAHRRAVRLGARNPDGQLVLSGLSSGALVAIDNLSKLEDGSTVKIAD